MGILGCGWLGTPLAMALMGKGYRVRGTTTRPEQQAALSEKGIDAYCLRLESDGFRGPANAFLSGLQSLVFNIPSGLKRNPDSDYTAKIRHLDRQLEASGCRRLIYVSSTTVYGNQQGRVDEASRPEPDSDAGKQLLEAEDLLLSRSGRATLVVRFGGLLGGERHPVKYLSGRRDLPGGKDPVNLIHREDCIRILLKAVSEPGWTGVVNGVHPRHPGKAVYYRATAEALGLPPPHFREESAASPGKQVNSRHPLLQEDQMVRSLMDG